MYSSYEARTRKLTFNMYNKNTRFKATNKSASRPKVVLDVVIHDIHQIIADLKTLIVMAVRSQII